MKTIRITPFLLLLSAGLLLCLGFVLQSLFFESESGVAVQGVMALVLGLVLGGLLLLEQLIIRNRKFETRKVWIAEGTMVVLLLLAYLVSLPPVISLKVNDEVQWFGIIYGSGTEEEALSGSFPRAKSLSVRRNGILLVHEDDAYTPTDITSPDAGPWADGYRTRELSLVVRGEKVVCTLYTPKGRKLSQRDLRPIRDSIRAKVYRAYD